MKHTTILNKAGLAILSLSIAMTSCKKVESPEPMGDAGQTLVKIVNGGSPLSPAVTKMPIDFLPNPTTLLVGDVRRDVPNQTELSKTMHVIVKDDTTAVHTANANYKILPAAWYTIGSGTPKTGGSGGNYNVTINSGDITNPIFITITDPTLLDPSTLYGLGFTITSVDANGKISQTNTTVVEIGAKNKYDGIYSVVSGTVTRYTAPGSPAGDALSGDLTGNPDVYLVTVGGNKCAIPPAGSLGGLFWAYGNNSMVAGIDGLSATVDPSTNLVTMASTGNGTLTNWAGHTNQYDPSTKTMTLAFRWNPTANVREYQVVLKYKASR